MAERFPPPWTVNGNANCYWVEAANGTRIAYVYFRQNGSVGSQVNFMSQDGARRIASNIAKLPEMISTKANGADGVPSADRMKLG